MELVGLIVERRGYRKAIWCCLLSNGAGDSTGKYIHHYIWAQRLTGKWPERNKKRKGRSTKDGGVVHGN
eukprot:16438045-Heterocapsa_arctica.AAC.1